MLCRISRWKPFYLSFCSGFDISHCPSGHSAGTDDAEAVDEFGVVCGDFVLYQYHRRILGHPFADQSCNSAVDGRFRITGFAADFCIIFSDGVAFFMQRTR